MTEVITDIEQATPAWLTGVLQQNGHLQQGRVLQVRRLGTEAGADSTTARLEVVYSGDTPLRSLPAHLLLKLAARPGFETGDREVAFYQVIAPAMQTMLPRDELPFVRCYAAARAASGETGRSYVLLEDLFATHYGTDPALPPLRWQGEQIMDALAGLHAFWWEHPRLGKDIGSSYTAESIQSLLAAAQINLGAFRDFVGDRVPPARQKVFEKICSDWPPFRARRLIEGKGITVVVRDAHAGNFLFPSDPASDRVRITNWHYWRLDTGTDDLAYMMAAHWFPERRARLEKRLLERYCGALSLNGVEDYDFDTCWTDYRASIIRVLLCLVGGWRAGRAPSIWWDRVERAMLAFEDLGCRELLP